MRIFVKYLKDFLKSHFQLGLYISFFLLNAILLYANFWLGLEKKCFAYFNALGHKEYKMIYFFLVQAVPYFLMLLLSSVFLKKWDFWKNKQFIFWSLFAFVILSFDRMFYYHKLIPLDVVRWKSYYMMYIGLELKSWATLGIPLLVVYQWFKKDGFGFYGLQLKGVKFTPYWLMLGIMFPLILAASFHSSFLNAYPKYPDLICQQLASVISVPESLLIAGYEVSYLLDFLTVELFFRGFLVCALMKYLDKEVILPMAVTYCVLHFGKPFGEALSSIFGGYIIGVFAYYSKNIWGGVFIHMGIAGLMELMAFLQKAI